MRILLILLVIVLMGCINTVEVESKYKIITNKTYFYWGTQDNLPKGLCRFTINHEIEFIDSCQYYYLGDTIGKMKNRFK